MKKGLLGLAAGLLVSGAAVAQIDGVYQQYEGAYLADYQNQDNFADTIYSFYYCKNVETDSMIVGEPWNLPILGKIDKWESYAEGQYAVSEEEGALKIDFTNQLPDDGKNYTDIHMTWTGMKDVADKTLFENDGDTLTGEIYKFDVANEKPLNVWVLCKAEDNLNLRIDLADGNGRYSNRISPRTNLQASDNYDWSYFTFSDTAKSDGEDVNKVGILGDAYGGDLNGVTSGRYDGKAPFYGRSGTDFTVLLDPDLIIKIGITIDDGDKGEAGDEKTLFIKTIQLGGEQFGIATKGEGASVGTADEIEGFTVIEGGILVNEEVEVYNLAGVKVGGGKGFVACPSGVIVVKSKTGAVAKVSIK